MLRHYLNELEQWKKRLTRKPLVIRGARQVGKTWLVREFARKNFQNLVEINFDETPEKQQLFAGKEVNDVLRMIEVDQGKSIIPQKTLFFLDEIQSAPNILAQLRYFYEKLPELHIITAGSLLDFSLAEHEFSMPVGRIEYMFMGPMTFGEFLLANNEQQAVAFLHAYEMGQEIPQPIHNKLMNLIRDYYVIGGMPAVVCAYKEQRNWEDVLREQRSILQTFIDDFAKYRRRINPLRLRKVFVNMPRMVGQKLKYSHIDREERAKDLAVCVELLEMARLINRVVHSACNGLPIGAEAKEKDFKPLFLDIGLVCNALGLKLTDLHMQNKLLLVNNGPATEQFIGQHLLYSGRADEVPELFYWNREKKNSSAEVDYVTTVAGKIIPVEVKAGKSGTLRSLKLMMFEKGLHLAVRFDANPPSQMDVTAKIPARGSCRFKLLSLPLYLVDHFIRLVEAEIKSSHG